MKTLILLLLLCAGSSAVSAQTASIIDRADILFNAGKRADAQKLLDAQLAKTTAPAERTELQRALSNLHFMWAEKLDARYDFQNAIAHYRQSYAIDKALDARATAFDLNAIGTAYHHLNRSTEAVPYFEQALLLLRQVKDRQGEAALLNNLGLAYKNLNRIEEALRNYEQAVPIYREVKDQKGEANTLSNIGSAYGELDRPDDALRIFQQALPLLRAAKDQLNEATTLNNLGTVYDDLSRYQESARHYLQALTIFRQIKNVKGEASALNNLGLTYEHLSRTEEALRYYAQALPIYRQIKDRKGEATALNNIGGAYKDLGRTDEALRSYRESLPISRAIQDPQGEARTLGSIGAVYDDLSRYDEAVSCYEQSLLISRAIKNRSNEATLLNNLGMVSDHLNRTDEALRYYQQALSIRREVQDRQGEAYTLNNMMFSCRAQQPELATLYGKQAVNVLQSIRRDNAGLEAASQTAYLENQKETYQTLAALLIEAGRLPEAEQITRMLTQSETFDFVRRNADQSGAAETLTLTPFEKDYLARYDTLGAQAATVGERIAALEKLPDATLTATQKTELDQLYQDREAIEGRFELFRRELVAAFGAVTPDLNTVDVAASDAWQKALERVSAQTGKKTALLTTVIAPETFYVILTTPTARLRFSHAIKSGDLNALVNRFRQQLTNPNLDPQGAAQELWQVVFCDGQLESALQAADVEVALWSLGGSLRYVPLDALHDGTTYLVARPRLNVVTTTVSKDYFDAPEGGRALGVGTSKAWQVELKDGAGAAVETVPFGALTQVPAEVRGIIGDANDGGIGPMPGQILLEGDFNETNLQAQLRRGAKTVHVATHFRLRPGDAQKSFLLLGDGNALPVFNWKVKMPLKNVELLTLSACETGLGGDAPQGTTKTDKTESSGAEVGSLGEVAQLQGAQAVIVSLWSVADSSTSVLMRDFYARWQAHPETGKGVALRDAQRALLGVEAVTENGKTRGATRAASATDAPLFVRDEKYPFTHPFYWAPFTLIGNWR